MQTHERAWLAWWSDGFQQQADISWHALPWFQLPVMQRQQLIARSPQALPALLEIPAELPGVPDPRLLQLVALNASQQQALFRLVVEVCQPGSTHPVPADSEWCSRLSRALHPDMWLPDHLDLRQPLQILHLLLPLFTAASWRRLRFRFPAEQVRQYEQQTIAEHAFPIRRLQALWDAALWRIQHVQEPV